MSNTKQHTEEFEKCVVGVVEQGHEKSSAFAICTDAFDKAGKPIYVGESERQKLHLFCESFQLEGNKVSGVAIHPMRIFHPEENMTHVYLREELERAAPSLAGKPFGIDHIYILPPPNLITKAWYCEDKGGVCFEGTVDDHIAQQIREKAFKGISIELNWLKPGGSVQYVNGVAAKNFELTSLHLLKQFPPGDPDAFVKLWEKMKEQLVVGPPLPIDQRVEALEQQLQQLQNQINVIVGKLDVLTGQPSQGSPSVVVQPGVPVTPQTIGGKMKMKVPDQIEPYKRFIAEAMYSGITWQQIQKKFPRISQALAESILANIKEAEWDTDYINRLPDSAFAYIEPGGEKDEEGKTTPRDLRHFPYKNAQGNLSKDHINNGLGRLGQDLGDWATEDAQAQIKKKLCAAVGSWNSEHEDKIESDVCGTTGTAGESIQEQQGNQEEPEKDEYGCIIGKERHDEETGKCVPITAEAQIVFLEAKLRLMEQEGELTVDQIKAKIAELSKQKEDLEKKLWPETPESGLSEDEKTALRTQIDILWAELDAYEQALKTKIADQATQSPPTQQPPQTVVAEADLSKLKETIVSLRKKLVDMEAQIATIEKQKTREATSWKERYEQLREAVKGAIPANRVWRSWSVGPQRYVQENLKILREVES